MEGKEELFTKKYVFIEGNLKNRYLRKGFLEKKNTVKLEIIINIFN